MVEEGTSHPATTVPRVDMEEIDTVQEVEVPLNAVVATEAWAITTPMMRKRAAMPFSEEQQNVWQIALSSLLHSKAVMEVQAEARMASQGLPEVMGLLEAMAHTKTAN